VTFYDKLDLQHPHRSANSEGLGIKPSVPHILVLRMERPMAIRIDYFRKGEKVAAVPFLGSSEASLKAAANGLKRLDADVACILDHKGKEVGRCCADITKAASGSSFGLNLPDILL
jgi:hypothetical protein